MGYLLNSGWIFRNFLFFGFPLFAMGYLIAKHRLHKLPRRDPQLLCAIFAAALLLVLVLINYRLRRAPAPAVQGLAQLQASRVLAAAGK